MYAPYFATYMLAGLILSVLVFLWALHAGQFRDQKRARFLPLEDGGEAQPVKVSRMNRIEGYLILGLACVGLLAMAIALGYSILTAR
jgi:cbb3-type cytochrome oxidase maturation protein